MKNPERNEKLRDLPPLEAVHAWLEGDFGIGDEPPLVEAIRRDAQVVHSDEEINEIICVAMETGIDAERCLQRLRMAG